MIFFKPKFWDKTKISFFAIVLFPITLILKLLIFLKNIFTKIHKFQIPIICVGNIYLGGTGKTPMCIEIFSILKNLNMIHGFVRKEYSSFRDEAELQKKIGPIYQNKKRVDAIKNAIKDGINIAILDDGFQDFSVNKNLSIVCFNEKQWIGNGLSIPSGPLREELSSLKRADCVILNGEKNIKIENKIYSKNKLIKIFYIKYKPLYIDNFKHKKVIAFAGIGNPINFFDLLKENNIDILEKIKFPDHYNYTKEDLEKLINKAKSSDSMLLTTEKDFFRIDENYQKYINCIKISVEIQNKNHFIETIKAAI